MKLAVELEMFTGYASKYKRRRRQANVEIAQMCEEYAVHCAARKAAKGGSSANVQWTQKKVRARQSQILTLPPSLTDGLK